jgi:hypothetical protein
MKALALIFILGALTMCFFAIGGLYRREYTGLGTVAIWCGLIDLLGLCVLVACKYL